MKRIIALIIAAILAVSCICAYAEPTSGSSGEGQPPQGGPGGTPPDGMTPQDGIVAAHLRASAVIGSFHGSARFLFASFMCSLLF